VKEVDLRDWLGRTKGGRLFENTCEEMKAHGRELSFYPIYLE